MKTFSAKFGLPASVLLAVALLFAGCSIWDEVGLPKPGIAFGVCVEISNPLQIGGVSDFNKFADEVATASGGEGQYHLIYVAGPGSAPVERGTLKNECCGGISMHPTKKARIAVQVTQAYTNKAQRKHKHQAALKDITETLMASR